MADTGVLPVTQPRTNQGEGDEATDCCCYLAVYHNTKEAGESRWFSWKYLMATRIVSSVTLLILGYLNVSRTLPFTRSVEHHMLVMTVFLICGVTQANLAVCSGFSARNSLYDSFSSVTVVVHGIMAAFLFLPIPLIIESAIALKYFPSIELLLLLPLMFFLLDIFVMSSRIRLRYRYIFIAFVIYTIYAGVAIALGFSACSYCAPKSRTGIEYRNEFIRVAVLVVGGAVNVWFTRFRKS